MADPGSTRHRRPPGPGGLVRAPGGRDPPGPAATTRRGSRPSGSTTRPGSNLFDEITRLPEYYPTEAERSILPGPRRRDRRADRRPRPWSSWARARRRRPACCSTPCSGPARSSAFVPFDVSEEVLRSAADAVAADGGPGGRARRGRRLPPAPATAVPTDGVAVLAFLGSTIGNLDPAQRRGFLAEVRAALDTDDWFLLGTDLVKDRARLVRRLRRRRGCHRRVQPQRAGRDEPGARRRLRPGGVHAPVALGPRGPPDRDAPGGDLGPDGPPGPAGRADGARCPQGEYLRTEISTKFTPEDVADELAAADLVVHRQWFDDDGDFLVTLARPA